MSWPSITFKRRGEGEGKTGDQKKHRPLHFQGDSTLRRLGVGKKKKVSGERTLKIRNAHTKGRGEGAKNGKKRQHGRNKAAVGRAV